MAQLRTAADALARHLANRGLMADGARITGRTKAQLIDAILAASSNVAQQ
jgi:hypothetical protein